MPHRATREADAQPPSSEMTSDRPSPELAPEVAGQPYAWLTTVGRRTGEPRTVELWFGLQGQTVYFLAGGGAGAHWVQNALAHPEVRLRLGSRASIGTARAAQPGSDEELVARRILAAKYQGWHEGRPLSRWAATSFCLAMDLLATEVA